MAKGDRIECTKEPLVGKLGTIFRPHIRDDGAWVRFDEDIPAELRSFNDERKNDVVLYPEDYKIVR